MINGNKNKIRFLHVMSHESVIFNKEIIDMINNNSEFVADEHVFVISNKNIYEQNRNNKNVIYEPNISISPKLFSYYANNSDYVFLHSYTFLRKMLLLKKEVLKKIIWIEWGHDLYEREKIKPKIYKIPRRIVGNFLRMIPKEQKKKFFAIGIGPKYDVIEAKRIYGKNMNFVMTPYGYVKDNKKRIDEVMKENPKKDYVKVMIGHSANPFLNHIEILKKLEKFKNENIKISLVLAYGKKEYADNVKKVAYSIFDKEKIEVIENMLTMEEYDKYLFSVDICILDYKHQAAMANFVELLYMNKKIFLNENGYLNMISKLENMETYLVQDIEKMDFNEFSKPVINNYFGRNYAEFYINEKNHINLWKNTIDYLKKVR